MTPGIKTENVLKREINQRSFASGDEWGTKLLNFDCFAHLTFSFHLNRTKTLVN